RGINQVFVLWFLSRLVEQRRVGRGILRLVLGDGLEVAGVGHHRGVTFQRVNQVHRGYSIGFMNRAIWYPLISIREPGFVRRRRTPWSGAATCLPLLPTGEIPRGRHKRCHPGESPGGAASTSWRSRRRGPHPWV